MGGFHAGVPGSQSSPAPPEISIVRSVVITNANSDVPKPAIDSCTRTWLATTVRSLAMPSPFASNSSVSVLPGKAAAEK